jgi:hypothetical protein
MDRLESRNDKRRPVLRNVHPQGARTMAGMRRVTKPSPTESPLLFEVDPKPLEETLTALGGIPLVVQAFRSLGLPGSVQQHVAVKERERGYDEATFVESFVILNAAGGECVDEGFLREFPEIQKLAAKMFALTLEHYNERPQPEIEGLQPAEQASLRLAQIIVHYLARTVFDAFGDLLILAGNGRGIAARLCFASCTNTL